MSWQENIVIGIVSGLPLPLVAAAVRFGWSRRRVPTALARSVRRRSYLSAVLAESRRPGVTGLDVLSPRLTPAAESRNVIGSIRSAWEQIDKTGPVRVVTLDSEECVKAGAELVVRGIEVRVTRREFGKESKDRPVPFNGNAGRCW